MNPNYEELPVKLPTCGHKVIKIEDFSPDTTPTPKAVCQGDHSQAIHIPGIPGLKVRNAEKKRQSANRRIAGHKLKSRFVSPVPIVHFQVGVGHLKYNEDTGAEFWNLLEQTFTFNQLNCELTSDILKSLILTQAWMQARRESVQVWLFDGDMGKEFNWALGHSNRKKDGTSRETAP